MFGAAICHVGVLDMLRYHRFTIGYSWVSEYGCADNPDQFKYLIKYSPLHNFKVPEGKVQYSATLLTTADHDDRVLTLHSYKYISELQYKLGKLPKQTNPLMIVIETNAGHGAGKPTMKKINEIVDVFCFIGQALNLEYTYAEGRGPSMMQITTKEISFEEGKDNKEIKEESKEIEERKVMCCTRKTCQNYFGRQMKYENE